MGPVYYAERIGAEQRSIGSVGFRSPDPIA